MFDKLVKKYWNQKAVMEALQEVARVAFFGAVSALVTWGLAQLGVMDQSATEVVIGTLLLKALDKYVHENPKIKSNGLTDTKMFKK